MSQDLEKIKMLLVEYVKKCLKNENYTEADKAIKALSALSA